MGQTLLEIAGDALSLMQLLDDLPSGELTPEAEEALNTWFAEVGHNRDEKLDNYCALIMEFRLRSKGRREESQRLAALAAAEENKAERMRDRLKLFMELVGEKKIETDRYRLTVAGNGGVQGVSLTMAAEQLPEEFQKVVVTPDNDKIRKALQDGRPIPGCVLIPRGTHLRIG